VAPVQLVRAVGDDQAERLLARAAHEERDEVARRPGGPVQVLDREQHGAGAAEALEQREYRLEQPALAGARLVVGARAGPTELGQQLRERVARTRRQRVPPALALGRERARGSSSAPRPTNLAELTRRDTARIVAYVPPARPPTASTNPGPPDSPYWPHGAAARRSRCDCSDER